eukprot:15438742-Alexandrium_andersonii.AAC.1
MQGACHAHATAGMPRTPSAHDAPPWRESMDSTCRPPAPSDAGAQGGSSRGGNLRVDVEALEGVQRSLR